MAARVPFDDELDSCDEVENRTLVPKNDTKSPRLSSALEIGQSPDRIGGRRLLPSSRCCLVVLLIAVFLSVLLALLLFRGGYTVHADSLLDRMRESELRALYLLKSQQLALLEIWNSTRAVATDVASPVPSAVNSTSVTTNLPKLESLVEFQLALLEQIKINKEIQNALLSSHEIENMTSGTSDDNLNLGVFGAGVDLCKKVDPLASRRTIEWKPKKDRYLFAICLSGQMSNHLICLEKHMFFAALLDRVLILPSPKFDYQYDKVLDIHHINECVGRKVSITFDEFSAAQKNKMKIDRFICYIASPPCYLDEEHMNRLKNLGLSLGKIEPAWPEDAKLMKQKKRVVGDIMPKFSSDDEVIAIGDMFYADVEDEWVSQPGGPLAHKCKTVIQPSHLIHITAQRFVQTFLGSNFIALHFRRHGFLKFCNLKEKSCFFPLPQAAECVIRVVEKANAPIIYLSTDAASSETNLLQSLVFLNGKPVPLVQRPEHNSTEKWDALLYRNNLGGDNQVEAMLDKTICALSSVFIGSSGSTFTEDIIRLRRGWSSASQCDEYLCEGEIPDYIAENE
ncbi:O-fucosyltransferase 36-like [Curcuma longa]|uniref:O-fucosyltransferase 36-like n=1 Tax=Curcuma longa TaxID=136217 RepID=UPI003D9E8200